MIIITSKYLIPTGYTAMAIFPFIIIRNKKLISNKVLINHEKVHLRQQGELLVLPFYFWYISEYFMLLLKFKNHKKAYHSICFEKEAYSNECNYNYLINRKLWSFMKYKYKP